MELSAGLRRCLGRKLSLDLGALQAVLGVLPIGHFRHALELDVGGQATGIRVGDGEDAAKEKLLRFVRKLSQN